MRKIITVLLLAVSFMLASGARAQYSWEILRKPDPKGREISYTALSTFGERCIIAYLEAGPGPNGTGMWSKALFLRSLNGGDTWDTLDPGLRLQKGQGRFGIRAVQWVDQRHIMAVGDSGVCLRSTNGGDTWDTLPLGTKQRLVDVHFSDSSTGIIIGLRQPQVRITHDGGNTWKPIMLWDGLWPIRGHSDGGSRFRVLTYDAGPSYRTNDDFASFDSTWIYPFSDTDHVISGCDFGADSMIVAYGAEWHGSLTTPFLVHSTDGGVTWSSTNHLDTSRRGGVLAVLSRSSSTIIACVLGRNDMFRSTDGGVSWVKDTIIYQDDSANYAVTGNCPVLGISNLSSGKVIAITAMYYFATPGCIIRGTPKGARRVDAYERVIYSTSIYPNPGSDRVAIASPAAASRPVWLIDVLGRVVLRDKLDASGNVTLNVSTLPAGIYGAMLDVDGKSLPVGNVVVAITSQH